MANEIFTHLGFPLKSINNFILTNGASVPTTGTTTTGTGFTPTLINCNGSADPSMVLTVTGASGSISWCGKVWNLPGDSGLQQEICPTYYAAPYTGTFGPVFGREEWDHIAGGGFGAKDGLGMEAQVIFSGTVTFQQDRRVIWADQGVGFNLTYPYSYTDKMYEGAGSTDFLNLGVMTAGLAMPTIGNYRISDGQFGSYTHAGVTYSWAKGANW